MAVRSTNLFSLPAFCTLRTARTPRPQLHLVHYNSDLYPSFSEAMKQPNGLAVIGVFLDASNSYSDENISGAENRLNLNKLKFKQPNEEINKLAQLMEKIPYKGQSTALSSVRLKELLPKSALGKTVKHTIELATLFAHFSNFTRFFRSL